MKKIEFKKPVNPVSLINDVKEFLTQMFWLFTFIALASILN